MICPHCKSLRTVKKGSGRALCLAEGHPADKPRSFNAISAAQADEISVVRHGIAPEHGLNVPMPAGYLMGKVTVQQAGGNVERTWTRMSPDAEMQQAALIAAVDAMAADLPRVKPRKASGEYLSDLMTAYPIGDPHIGMYSWKAETGDDWDLEIAREMHCAAMDALVRAAPATETALVINLGDLLHYDSMEAKTPRSGHMLDADGRYAKVIDVAVLTMRQCIESALAKHKFVRVVNVRGNHDETGALWLARLLTVTYEKEPRVSVDVAPSVFNYFRFGKVLIGMHHGHSCKPDKLPGVMAADRAKDWGDCLHRYWWQGHIHHESKKEFPGVTVESFNTLAAKDAYANDGGWRSARTMQAIVLHRDHGEVARSKVNAAMFERAEAA